MRPARAALVAAAALALLGGAAPAQTQRGCDAFKWPLATERAALAKAGKPTVVNGGALGYEGGRSAALAPLEEAGLVKPPERKARSPKGLFAGHFTLPAPPAAGVYKITVSADAWIDVIDGGGYLSPVAYTAASDCAEARRSVKFALPSRAVTLQLSGVEDAEIGVVVSPE